eukprot:COSAG02_NODE_9080_length_2338_cov_3.459134_2_plen_320_part_00
MEGSHAHDHAFDSCRTSSLALLLRDDPECYASEPFGVETGNECGVIWIGLSKTGSAEEDAWSWSDGNPLDLDSANWHYGYPAGPDAIYLEWEEQLPKVPASQMDYYCEGLQAECSVMTRRDKWKDEPCEVFQSRPHEYQEWSGEKSIEETGGEERRSDIAILDKPGCAISHHPYVCSHQQELISVPTGGRMLGCKGGGWVMGTPHNNSEFGITEAWGTRSSSEYNHSLAVKRLVNRSATTPAECISLVRRMHPAANGAEYSNEGHVWCNAVFDARGVIFGGPMQSCLFEGGAEEEARASGTLPCSVAALAAACPDGLAP